MNKLVLIAAFCIAATLPLWPSSAIRLDFNQLSRQADQVVAGKIINITPELDAETGFIYSTVTLLAASAIPPILSGKPYEFRMLGGEYGGRKLWIADFPGLKPGQEVVLFLSRDTSGIFGPTVGLWQGLYFIEADTATGAGKVLDYQRRPVLGIRGGNAILGLGPGEPGRRATAPELSPLGVKDFMQQVLAARSAVAAAGTPPRR